jgi:DNA-binding NarL/FixJ family response regulator
VLLVDDQDLVRAGFAMVLGSQPDINVVGEAADGCAAVRLARECPADVMVMDVRMPELDGVAATRAICRAGERPVYAYETGLITPQGRQAVQPLAGIRDPAR